MVLLLSQLNRSIESRSDKRPNMGDLRESGNIEQDADIILLLYRDDYYAEREQRASRAPGLLELIVAKQREGEVGSGWARTKLHCALVEDIDDDDFNDAIAKGMSLSGNEADAPKSGGFRGKGGSKAASPAAAPRRSEAPA